MGALTIVGVLVLLWFVYRVHQEYTARKKHATSAAIRAADDAIRTGATPTEAAAAAERTYEREIAQPAPATLPPPLPAANDIMHRLRQYDFMPMTMFGTEGDWAPVVIDTPEEAARMCDTDPRYNGCVGFGYDDGRRVTFRRTIPTDQPYIAHLHRPFGVYVRRRG